MSEDDRGDGAAATATATAAGSLQSLIKQENGSSPTPPSLLPLAARDAAEKQQVGVHHDYN